MGKLFWKILIVDDEPKYRYSRSLSSYKNYQEIFRSSNGNRCNEKFWISTPNFNCTGSHAAWYTICLLGDLYLLWGRYLPKHTSKFLTLLILCWLRSHRVKWHFTRSSRWVPMIYGQASALKNCSAVWRNRLASFQLWYCNRGISGYLTKVILVIYACKTSFKKLRGGYIDSYWIWIIDNF